jgi:glutaredoxin-related protein
MQKDILFYSNSCGFSKEILQIIANNHLKERFMLVSVDNKNLKLPHFVDRVPLLYTDSKKLIADENLLNYVKSFVSVSSLQPYALVGVNTNSYTDNYSFIQENDSELGDSARNFNILGFDQPIHALKEDESKNNNLNTSLEKYMADRDADLQKILGPKRTFV